MEKVEENTKEQFLVTQRMLLHTRNCLNTALANSDMVETNVPNKLLHSAQQWCEKAIVHREELRKIRVSICLKRRKFMLQLLKEVKEERQ